jgi:predicted nucleic acid-binding protein
MNVLDSSCWIEYFFNTPISNEFSSVVERPRELVVPTIVLYEVCKNLLPKTSGDDVIKFVRFMQRGRVIVLTSELAIRAADISRKHKLAMADSIVYATTLQHDAVLWTTDQHFDGLPNVQYFDKTQSG